MLPSVAPFPPVQPHHRVDRHFPPDGIGLSYGTDFADSAATPTPRPDVFETSFASRIQYPQPVQRIDAPGQIGPSFRQRSTGEHSLRRKTPNGTLAAGYDGTPGDTTIQPPATKHILVSSLNSGQPFPPQTGVLDAWSQPSSDTFSASRSSSINLTSLSPAYQTDSAGGYNKPYDFMPDVNGTSWIRSVNHHPGVDSMLHQTLPTPPAQLYHIQNGAYVPTVLPATLQSSLGPTASAGSGPYGPYWPDGAYIPYRPAALRDSRFPPSVQFAVQYGQIMPQLFDAGEPPPNQLPNQPSGYADAGLSWTHHATPMLHSNVTSAGIFPEHHTGQKSVDMSQNQRALPYHTRQRKSVSAQPGHVVETHSPVWPRVPTAHSFATVPATVQNRAAHVEFKEKVLTWAHKVYVDLLATIHQARRNSGSSTGVDSRGHRARKPSIYPKPPRQPGSDFTSYQNSARPLPHHDSHPAPQCDQTRNFPGDFDVKPAEPVGGVASAHLDGQRVRSHSVDFQSHGNLLVDRLRSLGRLAGSAPAHRFQPTTLNEGSTRAQAVSALEMLSHLCNESGWEWIDGMLLGGCLAYGLGDYHKALRWYSRIIARDSTHVEAISNLAATLLALDRREDALQHWMRAVKLRPSFFEAVEHLIGLLCTSHRSREAVNVIDHVQTSLRLKKDGECFAVDEHASESESDAESRTSSISDAGSFDRAVFDYEDDLQETLTLRYGSAGTSLPPGFGSSGYAIPGADNGRMLALVHAKGNMLYGLGDNRGAATAFEDAILIAAGRRRYGIQSLVKQIFVAFSPTSSHGYLSPSANEGTESILLYPDRALRTAKLVFPGCGTPPGLKYVAEGVARKAAVSTTSNSLLSLAKIYQDGMASVSTLGISRPTPGVRDILALYYLSLSLQPSPSTANNVGILLASIHHNAAVKHFPRLSGEVPHPDIPGVIPGSGVSLALAYYNYGLHLDSRHAHLYTNLGSLLKDIGQLQAAIKMYEQAVQCDPNFDIALANLANAVKDAGRINDAIAFYKRAVKVNPDFAEAVCGLANALNSVCNWAGRGGITNGHGFRDRWHVNEQGMLVDAYSKSAGAGWIKRVVDIVDRQLREGESWGRGLLTPAVVEQLCGQLAPALQNGRLASSQRDAVAAILRAWSGQKWEGARVVRLLERATRSVTWQWYQDRYVYGKEYPLSKYRRPQLPSGLTPPNAPTVLPFHTFTYPLSAKQIRHISQRNGLRISCSTLRSSWLPSTVYRPPSPPNPYLRVGYVSSDFNNHPLAHLMQSVFGLHDPARVKAYCYATTASDKSAHRRQIEKEAPVFHDASSWSVDRLVQQIVDDGIHILVNLNGYTRGARNEVFAARPAPIHMSFMGFAGTLGAEWCDYILSDPISIPPETLGPRRRDARIEDRLLEEDHGEELEDWVYSEKIVYTRDTFFCCDHRQSAPDSQDARLGWEQEQERRWRMRKELFPDLDDDAIILGNFNQLYKIEPTTFRTWLQILARVPNAVLWLLRFPETGEQNLRQTAIAWAGEETASRIIFTDVAPKNTHIARAKVLDLFLDTPECNAHTTATDVLWSGTPLLTYPRYTYKMCSRMASSILSSAVPDTEAGRQAREELIASSDEDYKTKAIRLCHSLRYETTTTTTTYASSSTPASSFSTWRRATGRLADLRRMIFTERWTSRLFDTKRWVHDLEDAYEQVWKKWVNGEEGDIWL